MLFDIQTFLEKYYAPDEKIILACSTWADSMFVLYHILNSSYRDNLVACYFNHQTRDQCADEEAFLITLWKKEGFEVEVAECDFEKIKKLYPSKSFEELAREKRYQFFDAACHLHKASKVITAHHLDDRIETMLFNMLRGSKLTGLINMTESSANILRPLLWLEKSQILECLQENNLTYFEDESNASSTHTRNFIRNEILPKFEQVHPEHKKNLSNLLSYFQELKTHLDSEVSSILWEENYFSVSAFQSLSPLLQKELIREVFYRTNNHSTIWLTQGNIAEVIKFIGGKNNKTKKEIHGMNLFKDGDRIEY
jgi:tRNA(Ile)-lysidine synthase